MDKKLVAFSFSMLLFISLSIFFLACIAAVYNYKENVSAIYLSIILVVFATYSLTHYFTVYGKDPYPLAILYGHFSPLWFLIGPFIYFYARSLYDQSKSKLFWTDFYHFIPFFIHLISISKYYFQPFQLKLDIANAVIEDLNNISLYNMVNSLYSQNLAYILRPALLLAYSTYSLIYVLKKSKIHLIEYFNWVLFFLISMIIIAISFELLTFLVLSSKNLKEALLHSPFHLLTGISFLSVPVSIVTIFPEIIYGKKKFKVKKKTPNPALEEVLIDTDETQVIAAQIKAYLEDKKPYLNTEFTQNDIERDLDLTTDQVRKCLKFVFKKKFTELRSEYRVNHAKALLAAGTTKNTSIDGIGVLSGFSNRANFYATFKLFTGLTPTEFLKSLEIKSPTNF